MKLPISIPLTRRTSIWPRTGSFSRQPALQVPLHSPFSDRSYRELTHDKAIIFCKLEDGIQNNPVGAESRAAELDHVSQQIVSGSRMGLKKQKNGFGFVVDSFGKGSAGDGMSSLKRYIHCTCTYTYVHEHERVELLKHVSRAFGKRYHDIIDRWIYELTSSMRRCCYA